jgi:hypothetical protein
MGGYKGPRVARLVAAVVAVSVFGIGAGIAGGGSVRPGGNNWGGYAAIVAQNQTFTSVTSTFVVPTLDCSATAGHPAGGTLLELWSALDGANPAAPVSIEQVGVEAECHDGVQTNPTAYSMQFTKKKGKLSQASGRITLNGSIYVNTGDTITAAVSHGGALVTFTLTDSTTGANGSFSKKCAKKSCSFTSAEAFVEAPAPAPIPSFGSVSFTASSVTDSLGHTSGLVTSGPGWNTEQLTLIGTDMAGHRLVPCATPGPYDTVTGGFAMTDTHNCVTGS